MTNRKEKRRYFVVSDVHSFFDEMIEALNEKGFDVSNPNHIFISNGDLFDRGSQSRECLKFVMSLPQERRILIKGNHEYLYEQVLKTNYFVGADEHNGTFKTFCHLANLCRFDPPEAIIREASHNYLMNKYLSELISYFETDKYIITHGYIPCERTQVYNYKNHSLYDVYEPLTINWRAASEEQWEKATWICSYDAWNQEIKDNLNKTIITGHWNSSYGWNRTTGAPQYGKGSNNNIFYADGLIMLDACTASSLKVNCFVFEE